MASHSKFPLAGHGGARGAPATGVDLLVLLSAVACSHSPSSIMAMTAPAETVSPAAAERPDHDPGAVGGERLFHLHRFEHDDEVALGDRVTLGRRPP